MINIENNFNNIEKQYNEFYESAITFNCKRNASNKKRVLANLAQLRQSITLYATSVKNLYLGREDEK